MSKSTQPAKAKNLLYAALDYDFCTALKKIKGDAELKTKKERFDVLTTTFNIKKPKTAAASHYPLLDSKTIGIISYSSSNRKKTQDRPAYIKSINDLAYFTSGEFLGDRDADLYRSQLTKVLAGMKKAGIAIRKSDEGRISLTRLFNDLYSFRKTAYYDFERAEFFPQGDSLENEYSSYIKKTIADKMQGPMKMMDDLLCMLIDPRKK